MRLETEQLIPAIEAVLFAADQPVTVTALRDLFGGASTEDIEDAIARLAEKYEAGGHGVHVAHIAGGVQILTQAAHADWVDLFLRGKRKVRLTRSALEALAIVAYKQPVTKVEIDEIRGVDSSGVVATLLERGLIAIAGRTEGVGRPLLYATTDEFLSYFGLSRLEELPRLSEITQLLETSVAKPEDIAIVAGDEAAPGEIVDEGTAAVVNVEDVAEVAEALAHAAAEAHMEEHHASAFPAEQEVADPADG
jgi:segregation and condensation protein B